MRRRVVHPDFFKDEDFGRVSDRAKIIYQAMTGLADDQEATLPNKPNWIRAYSHPYDRFEIFEELKELAQIGKIVLFIEDGKQYWYLPEFFVYQRIDTPSNTKYPVFKREKMPKLHKK